MKKLGMVFVALLMAIGGNAMAAERTGVVLFRLEVDSPFFEGTKNGIVYLDTDDNGEEDTSILFTGINMNPDAIRQYRKCVVGAVVVFDDENADIGMANGMLAVSEYAVKSITRSQNER